MPARKIRIEVFDSSGNRYTVTFEGAVTREKALRLLDLVELLGGVSATDSSSTFNTSNLTKFEKLRLMVEKHFPIVWFSSKDVQFVYEEEFKEPIGLSTVSTYLSRMADRGFLAKGGSSNRHSFRALTTLSKASLDFIKNDRKSTIQEKP
jgi:hypothetical protein